MTNPSGPSAPARALLLAGPPLALAAAFLPGEAPALLAAQALLLLIAVFAAVHHAEVVAHGIGQPFGALVLAVAVTTVEAGLILTLMQAGGADATTLARDSLFAAIMICTTGIIGLCLLVGGARYHIQRFQREGARAALAALTALAVLVMIVPNFTQAAQGPVYSPAQLAVVGALSAVLYLAFAFSLTVSHRSQFTMDDDSAALLPDDHGRQPLATTLQSAALMVVGLGAVVLLAKHLSHPLEDFIDDTGLPRALVGIVVAAVVLLPESIVALRAARANQLQTSMNLALGSALATIGLTIPVLAAFSVLSGTSLVLGLGAEQMVLLALVLTVCVITLGSGVTTFLLGAVHLVLFAAFLLFAFDQ